MNKKINGRIGNLGNKETMARNLKKYLDSRGLNPHQFADIMNFKYTTVMNWMSANSYPRIDKIELMAQYFGINKSDLVEEDDEQSTSKRNSGDLFNELDDIQQAHLLKLSKINLNDAIVDTAEIMAKADEVFRDKVFSYADYEYFKYLKELEEKNTGNRNSAS